MLRDRIPRCLVPLLALASGWMAVQQLRAQDSASPTAAELIEWERARATVAAALQEIEEPAPDGDVAVDNFVNAVNDLALFGPGVVPFLVNELEQELPNTFSFCAYALGRLDTPESEAALRRAIERADADEQSAPDFAITRKAWAAWALALQGKVDALDLFNAGKRESANYSMHHLTSVLEAGALQTWPACIPRLLAQLDRHAAQDKLPTAGQWPLRALRRVADPSAVPRVVPLLDHAEASVRSEAARTLGNLSSAGSIAALLEALDDGDITVRRQAALSLELLRPQEVTQAVASRLASAEDATLRGALYRVIARAGGTGRLEALRSSQGRPDPKDRLAWVQALGLLRDPAALDLLSAALADPDTLVAVEAATAVAEVGSKDAVEILLAQVPSKRWPVAQTAIAALVQLREPKAAPLMTESLVRVALPEVLVDVTTRTRVEFLGDGLVDLRYHQALGDLRTAAADQHDGTLLLYLEGLFRRLEALSRNQGKLGRWLEALGSEHAEIRRLAYERLGELGGEKAARALVEAFSKAAAEERLPIVEALGSVDSPPSMALIEHILTSEEFDPVRQLPLREMAAWSARRLGGQRMLEALKTAVERRNGREAKVMIYLALLGGREALPTLAAYRARRMQYLKWTRGLEQEQLDLLARDIAAGRSVSELDVAPAKIHYH